MPPSPPSSAATEDEAFDRLREQKAQREAKETKKKKQQKGNNTSQQHWQAKSKDAQIEENICQGCGDCYDDDDTDTQEFWVGCDRCPRWYHYWCVNLGHMPYSLRRPLSALPASIIPLYSNQRSHLNSFCSLRYCKFAMKRKRWPKD